MAAKIYLIILIWLGITFANELTIDAPIFEKLFLADDSGFFAVGLVIYEFFRGRRDPKLYAMLALSVGTAVFQSLHKLIRLGPHTGGTFDHTVVVAICLIHRHHLRCNSLSACSCSAGLVVAIGGLTYPLYLLHMQLGYVFLMRFSSTDAAWAVSIIISGLVLLSWIV